MKIRGSCSQCIRSGDTLDRALYDMAHIPARDLRTLTRMAGHQTDRFSEQVKEFARRRRQENIRDSSAVREKFSRMRDEFFDDILDILTHGGDTADLVDSYFTSSSRHALEERLAQGDITSAVIEEKDVLETLNIFLDAGLIDLIPEGYRLTPQGSNRLARYILKNILENINPGLPGINPTGDEGFGMSEGFTTRRYEFGDEFSRIDTQATLLTALERGRVPPLKFTEADIHIRETISASRIASGLMIDASGSMAGDKLTAARDVALALSALIGKSGSDILKIYVFANSVREIRPWQILDHRFPATITDIVTALKKFRRDIRPFRGEKQVYLITDMAPNTENGSYVGSERAAAGVLGEARRCSLEHIIVNIILLGEAKNMGDLASTFARKNAGRVFFVQPGNLGNAIIEDYLRKTKRRKGPR